MQIDTLSSELISLHTIANKKQRTKASKIVTMATENCADKSGVDINLYADFELECSQNECILAIKNLIDNAIKHSKDNKCFIEVHKSFIKIKSNGEKIETPLDELCKPFVKGENSKGFGLGLYLVKKFTDKNSLSLSLTFENDSNVFELHI